MCIYQYTCVYICIPKYAHSTPPPTHTFPFMCAYTYICIYKSKEIGFHSHFKLENIQGEHKVIAILRYSIHGTLHVFPIPASLSICVFVLIRVSDTQSCPTLCNPMDGSPPGSSVHGILQAGILEWVAISSSTLLIYS